MVAQMQHMFDLIGHDALPIAVLVGSAHRVSQVQVNQVQPACIHAGTNFIDRHVLPFHCLALQVAKPGAYLGTQHCRPC